MSDLDSCPECGIRVRDFEDGGYECGGCAQRAHEACMTTTIADDGEFGNYYACPSCVLRKEGVK